MLIYKVIIVPVAWSVAERQNSIKRLLIIYYILKSGLYRFSIYFTSPIWFTFPNQRHKELFPQFVNLMPMPNCDPKIHHLPPCNFQDS